MIDSEVKLLDHIKALMSERDRFFEAKFTEFEKSMSAQLVSIDKSVSKIENANEKRVESINELRKALSDMASLQLPRSEFNVAHAAIIQRFELSTQRIIAVESSLLAITARNDGKSQGLSTLGAIILGVIAASSFLVSAVSFFYNVIRKGA